MITPRDESRSLVTEESELTGEVVVVVAEIGRRSAPSRCGRSGFWGKGGRGREWQAEAGGGGNEDAGGRGPSIPRGLRAEAAGPAMSGPQVFDFHKIRLIASWEPIRF